MKVLLPSAPGILEEYRLSRQEGIQPDRGGRFHSRVAFAAAHVVIDPFRTENPWTDCEIDFEATLSYRRHLWSLGFGVAEAMDTAQRGMGLNWANARDLIRFSCAEAKAVNGAIACGVNTDTNIEKAPDSLDAVTRAYEEQSQFVEDCGGRVILMASRHLARCAQSREDYLHVYRRVLSQVSKPVILHWLGEAFDPSLAGYWGGSSVDASMETVIDLIHSCRSAIDGIKISLLDQDREIQMRRLLPSGVRMYTGDDYHYPELIEGDEQGYSDALLGIFDAIAPAASAAFLELDRGNLEQYRKLLQSTLPLSRHIFSTPVYFYKTGIVFLAYLNGWQDHFKMLGGQESARSLMHLSSIFKLADEAGLLADPERATSRLRTFLATYGVC